MLRDEDLDAEDWRPPSRVDIEFAKFVIDDGDAAVAAYMLGVPKEDIDRVAGGHE